MGNQHKATPIFFFFQPTSWFFPRLTDEQMRKIIDMTVCTRAAAIATNSIVMFHMYILSANPTQYCQPRQGSYAFRSDYFYVYSTSTRIICMTIVGTYIIDVLAASYYGYVRTLILTRLNKLYRRFLRHFCLHDNRIFHTTQV